MDPKQLLLDHFEKALLGIAALLLLLAGFSFVSGEDTGGGGPNLDKKIGVINDYMRTSEVEAVAAMGWSAQLDANFSKGGAAEVEEYPGWVMHKRPGLLFETAPPPITEVPEHYAPEQVNLGAGRLGQAELIWEDSANNRYVVITEYEVQRKEGLAGEWSAVATVSGEDPRAFMDSSLAARIQYFYRVVSRAEIDREDPKVKEQGMTLPEELALRVSQELGPVETSRDVYVIPINVTPVTQEDLFDDPNAKGSAYLRVYKWDADAEAWRDAPFTVTEGEKIGKPKKIGRQTYDFGTGAVLEKVKIEERDVDKFGTTVKTRVHVIRVLWPDNSVEEKTDKDPPPGKEE